MIFKKNTNKKRNKKNNYKNKIIFISKKAALDKTIYKEYKVYINNILQELIAFKIKSHNELIYKVEGFKELYEKNVYLYRLKSDKFFNSLNSNIDIVCCNNEMKIIHLEKMLKKNKYSTFKFDVEYLWIVKNGFIDYFNLKIGDTISTIVLKEKSYL